MKAVHNEYNIRIAPKMIWENENPVPSAVPEVSIIVPARNEEASLERCLRSLVSQKGIPFELILINDGSTDRTAEIIQKFANVKECPVIGGAELVRVIGMEAGSLPEEWTGKANAVFAGTRRAQGKWLLFTDADTEHLPFSLAKAVEEARSQQAELLSYSPEQEVHGIAERALMPVIFAELATTFKPAEVSDPKSATAAANGQYLLITREAYDAVGGHAAVAGNLLEDVALAWKVKASGRKICFRFGGDRVRTRMYRGWQQLRDGWTKNLVLLFSNPERLALKRLLEFSVIVFAIILAIAATIDGARWFAAVAAIVACCTIVNFYLRIRKAHFDVLSTLLAFFGGPLFAYVLLRSVEAHQEGTVEWKGRVYPVVVTNRPVDESTYRKAGADSRD